MFGLNWIAGFGGFLTKRGEHPGVAGRLHKKPTTEGVLFQAAGLASLEAESEQAGEALAETVRQGEKLLGSIQAALHDIANRWVIRHLKII